MRTTRTLLLAAFAAITALALTASTATAGHLGNEESHAGETLEVIDEAGGLHCPAVELDADGHNATGGCEVNAHGVELELSGHAFGIEETESICDVEFSGHVDQHGEGWIDGTLYSDSDPLVHGDNSCVRESCEEGADEEPWPVHADEENGQTYIQAEFCVAEDGNHDNIERCLVEIPFWEASPHHYESGLNDATDASFHQAGHNHANAPNCELESATGIAIEGTPVELVHP